MAVLFGVREFQFFNAFEGYTHPPAIDAQGWTCAHVNAPVRRSVISAYTDEIRRFGGRSWFSVHVADGRPIYDLIPASAKWARQVVPAWAEFVSSLGFSGVHWAGPEFLEGSAPLTAHGADLPGFLRAAEPSLQANGLQQTCDFVDGVGWKPELVENGIVSFPVWSASEGEPCSAQMERGGVYTCFEGASAGGDVDVGTIIRRWGRARCAGSTYLAAGDGSMRLRNAFYSDAAELTEDEEIQIRSSVFDGLSCPSGSIGPVIAPALRGQASIVELGEQRCGNAGFLTWAASELGVRCNADGSMSRSQAGAWALGALAMFCVALFAARTIGCCRRQHELTMTSYTSCSTAPYQADGDSAPEMPLNS